MQRSPFFSLELSKKEAPQFLRPHDQKEKEALGTRMRNGGIKTNAAFTLVCLALGRHL